MNVKNLLIAFGLLFCCTPLFCQTASEGDYRYESRKHGLSVVLPQGWTIKGSNVGLESVLVKAVMKENGRVAQIMLQSTETTAPSIQASFAVDLKRALEDHGMNVAFVRYKKIGKHGALLIQYTDERMDTLTREISVIKKGALLTLDCTCRIDDYNKYRVEFEKALESFVVY